MRFPPIKSDRALLWITLVADETVAERAAALRVALKQCRLHPLDTTGAAELVIVDPMRVREQIADVRAALGDGDMLHLITRLGERLSVEVIARPSVDDDTMPTRPPARRPPWLQD